MKNKIDKTNLNIHMFLEDFCSSYSIFFSPLSNNYLSKYTVNDNKNLKELLTYNDYSYFSYNFDELLEQITYDLLVKGKAYVEIAKIQNEKNKLVGLDLIILDVINIKKSKNTYIVNEKSFNGEVYKKIIYSTNLIIFDVSEIGLSKKHLNKMMKKMCKVDLPKTELLISQNDIGFDFNKYIGNYNYKKLSICKDIYWFFRDNDNPFFSECYLLYRIAKFSELRQKIFKYLLSKINNGLFELGKMNDFAGYIKESWKSIDYEKCLKNLSSGEYNTSQAGDIIIEKRTKRSENV